MRRSHSLRMLLVLCLVLVVVVAACGKKAEVVQPVPKEQPTPTAEKPKPILLKHASMFPESTPSEVNTLWWTKEVEKQSNGRLQFEYFFAESLVSGAEAVDAVAKGLVQVATWTPGYNPDVVPLVGLVDLPLISPDSYSGSEGFADLYKDPDFPDLRNAFRAYGIEYLCSAASPFQEFISTKPLPNLASMKGIKVRTYGRVWPKLIEAVGGVGVGLSGAQVYEGLSRGTIDASVFYVPETQGWKLDEVAKHYTWDSLRGSGLSLTKLINWQTFQSLPADLQQIIRDVTSKTNKWYWEYHNSEIAKIKDSLTAGGMNWYEWPEEDKAAIRAAVQPFYGQWAAEMDAKGVRGTEALKLYQKHVATRAAEPH